MSIERMIKPRNIPSATFTIGSHGERVFDEERAEKPNQGSTECIETVIDKKGLSLVFKETLFKHFKLAHGVFNTTHGAQLNFNYTGEVVQMVFQLKGDSIIAIDGNTYGFKTGEHNIMFRPPVNGQIELCEGRSEVILVDLDKDFFFSVLPQNSFLIDYWRNAKNKRAGYLSQENMTINPVLNLLLNDIQNCGLKEELRQLHIHAKVLELLSSQLELFNKGNINRISGGSNDREKMQLALEYVTHHYKNPLSLKQLATKVGTNEYTLKKNFKAIYGTTVFGYICELRMEKAKQLLVNKSMTISQISDKVGYRNPQHFSTAFKKRYGICPSELKATA
ncbi:MAG: hypothetical protein CML05_15580 [Pseudozobellia sp.]|nr:hypothetical protein [Pseudozobellia sp.]|tara:strand:+ start:2745 stop:3752 length:1008 start_codon:yes stop_codon:yes gene_type:complete